MTTTDPKLIERIARAIRDDKDCRGRGEYEASLLLAAAINEAAQQAAIVAMAKRKAGEISGDYRAAAGALLVATAIERGEWKEQG